MVPVAAACSTIASIEAVGVVVAAAIPVAMVAIVVAAAVPVTMIAAVLLVPAMTPVVAPVESVALVEVESERGTKTAYAGLARTKAAPFVMTPVAMDPVVVVPVTLTIVERAAIPLAVIKYRTVRDRKVPETIGASKVVAIAAAVVRKSDAAAGSEAEAETVRLRRCACKQRGPRHRRCRNRQFHVIFHFVSCAPKNCLNPAGPSGRIRTILCPEKNGRHTPNVCRPINDSLRELSGDDRRRGSCRRGR